jgi:hypothetical protein
MLMLLSRSSRAERRDMKRVVFWCAVAILAGSAPAAAQVATLKCSFKTYQAGKFLSDGSEQVAIDYGAKTVNGRPAKVLSDRVVWDEVGANLNSTATYYKADGRYHYLNRASDNVLTERYGACK